MKILQRNLKRSTFVVWEMKRNVSVVCVCSAPNCSDKKQRSASQPASLFPASLLSLCHLAEGAYTIRLLFVSVSVCVSSHRIVGKCIGILWRSECLMFALIGKQSIKLCQQQFLEKFGGRHPPSKSSIWALLKKLETKGTLLDEHSGGRPKMSEETIQSVKDRLLASPKKSLRRFSHESGLPRSTCQRAAKKEKLHTYRISVIHELKEPDQVKRVAYCRWFQTLLKENPGILDYTWFSDQAWFLLSG